MNPSGFKSAFLILSQNSSLHGYKLHWLIRSDAHRFDSFSFSGFFAYQIPFCDSSPRTHNAHQPADVHRYLLLRGLKMFWKRAWSKSEVDSILLILQKKKNGLDQRKLQEGCAYSKHMHAITGWSEHPFLHLHDRGYIAEMESGYVCGTEGTLAPAGALLGLDASARNQLEQQQQHQQALYMGMQSGMGIDSTSNQSSQFLWGYSHSSFVRSPCGTQIKRLKIEIVLQGSATNFFLLAAVSQKFDKAVGKSVLTRNQLELYKSSIRCDHKMQLVLASLQNAFAQQIRQECTVQKDHSLLTALVIW